MAKWLRNLFLQIPEKPQDKASDKPAAKVRYGGRQRNKKKQQNDGPEEVRVQNRLREIVDV